MHISHVLLATVFAISQTTAQEKSNPLFHELVSQGVAVGQKIFVPLPTPILADGLDAGRQMAAIKKAADGQVRLDDVLRNALVAKHYLKIREIKPADPQAPAHMVDVWFVAYGDLDTLARKDPQALFNLGRKETKVRSLTAADLAQRNLRLKPELSGRESYQYVSSSLFDEVQVSMATRTVVSQTADSFLIARRLDPTFRGDTQFPNQWQRLKEDAADNLVPVGSPAPYEGVGMYVKFTRLAEPRGALFVEYHQVFTEPKMWFQGANVLRTKLPLLIQTEVRTFRRDLKKWSSG